MNQQKNGIKILYQQQGGTLIDARDPSLDMIEHLYEFISHSSNIDMLGKKSLYGVNYRLSIPKNGKYASPFYSSEMATFGKPITSILMKFVLLSDVKETKYWVNGYEKYSMIRTEFVEEIKTQQTIYTQSSMLGSPVTVAVIGAMEALPDQLEQLLAITDKEKWSDLMEIHKVAKRGNYSVGVICMEFLETFETMDTYINEKKTQERVRGIAGLIGYAYIRMAMIGYIHFDIHTNNIMVDKTHIDYLMSPKGKSVAGRIIFIDFGRVQRIGIDYVIHKDYLRAHGAKNCKTLMNYLMELQNDFSLTGFNYVGFFEFFFDYLDIYKNSFFNMYVNKYGTLEKLKDSILQIVSLRMMKVNNDLKNGRFAASPDVNNDSNIELLNLTRINKLKSTDSKHPRFNYMGIIDCYEKEMCKKIPIELNRFSGVDIDLIVLCSVLNKTEDTSTCTEYLIGIYMKSIAPKPIRKLLVESVEAPKTVSKEAPKSSTNNDGCKETHIRNPSTHRCVSRSGRIGRTILSGKSPKKHQSRSRRMLKPCSDVQIRNPTSGRCVSKTGRVGKRLSKSQ
jgi:hypothetical protein